MNELQSILLSNMPLLISADGYRQLMVSAFPLHGTATFLFPEPKAYDQQSREALQTLVRQLASCRQSELSFDGRDHEPVLTMDYSDPELPDGSVAYHRVWGIITAESSWRFSSKRLEQQLLEAEQNPQIGAHLLHVNSPGGEAWYLDRLSATMRQLQKPVVTLYETMCSAAYYIGCHARRVYATTQFDFVGCLGTMTSFYDFEPYYEKLGISVVRAKATRSDLKNKVFEDLCRGQQQQYVDEILNPLNDAFLSEVRAMRPLLAKADDDAPVMRGETFYTPAAVTLGLADGQRTLSEVFAECVSLGREWRESVNSKQTLYGLL